MLIEEKGDRIIRAEVMLLDLPPHVPFPLLP
jgi:hypothetical protein